MDFRGLLSGLADKYDALQEENRTLRQERGCLEQEVARLKKALDDQAPSLDIIEPALPGSVEGQPVIKPVANDTGVQLEGDGHGVVTLQHLRALQLQKDDTQSDGLYFATLKVGSKSPTITKKIAGPIADWQDFTARLPVDKQDASLDLQVFESLGAHASARSVGSITLHFRSLASGSKVMRREQLLPSSSLIEFEVSWESGAQHGRAPPREHATPKQELVAGGAMRHVSTARSQFSQLSPRNRSTKVFVDEKTRTKHMERFRTMFGADDDNYVVTARWLRPVLESRGLNTVDNSGVDQVEPWLKAVEEYLRATRQIEPPPAFEHHERSWAEVVTSVMVPAQSPQQSFQVAAVRLADFAEAIKTDDLPSVVKMDKALYKGFKRLRASLLKEDVREVIDRVTKQRAAPWMSPSSWQDSSKSWHDLDGSRGGSFRHKVRIYCPSFELYLNVTVALAVLVSLSCLGMSYDYRPNHSAWDVVEIVCTCIFVVEIVIKHLVYGAYGYWKGPDRYWNWMDFSVTAVSVAGLFVDEFASELAAGFSVGRLSLTFRALRVLRLAKVFQVMGTPFVRELSNMLVGFVLGAPALFWVIFLLGVVVLLVGMMMRIAIGPIKGGGDEIMSRCGSGDDPLATFPTCDNDHEKALMYAEEFCGTILSCSFTVFRCMIGDCGTASGQSLVVRLSKGFGLRFDVVYALGMIVLIFGLFNVITAIFVEATMAGLKYSETKQKLRSAYEAAFVKKKLHELVDKVKQIVEDIDRYEDEEAFEKSRATNADGPGVEFGADVKLDEDDFFTVLANPEVQEILHAIDIDLEGAGQDILFEIMDDNGSKEITLAEMLACLLKLRGGPMKVDMIAPLVALRNMKKEIRDEIRDLQMSKQ